MQDHQASNIVRPFPTPSFPTPCNCWAACRTPESITAGQPLSRHFHHYPSPSNAKRTKQWGGRRVEHQTISHQSTAPHIYRDGAMPIWKIAVFDGTNDTVSLNGANAPMDPQYWSDRSKFFSYVLPMGRAVCTTHPFFRATARCRESAKPSRCRPP